MGIYIHIHTGAVLTAEVPIIEPVQKHEYNTKTVQIH